MLERFLQCIKKHALFLPTDKLLVAVSGGVDSIVLCELLKASQHRFVIAHCNFNLRNQDSSLDEEFVETYARKIDVPFFSASFDTRAYAQQHKISTQMAARELRYEWFEQLMKEEGIDHLLTAHHKNDLAETMLLNMTRGTSINGLAGIPIAEKGRIRPLLPFTKSELLGYAINHQVKWREDLSNASTNYRRNKIRHEIVPVLEEINPGFLKQMERLAEKNQVVKQVFAKHMDALRGSLFHKVDDTVIINKEAVQKAQVSAFELEELLLPYGFNYDQCAAILEGLDGRLGIHFESEHYELFVERKDLRLIPRGQKDQLTYTINEGQSSIPFGVGYQLERLSAQGLTIDTNPKNALFDWGKIRFPLHLRPWRQGDRFQPLGMKGSKLVSDFLIDEKVPLSQKGKVYVLVSHDEIIWVVGYRIAEHAKVRTNTKEVLYISSQGGLSSTH